MSLAFTSAAKISNRSAKAGPRTAAGTTTFTRPTGGRPEPRAIAPDIPARQVLPHEVHDRPHAGGHVVVRPGPAYLSHHLVEPGEEPPVRGRPPLEGRRVGIGRIGRRPRLRVPLEERVRAAQRVQES